MATTGQRELVKVKGWARLIIDTAGCKNSIQVPGRHYQQYTMFNNNIQIKKIIKENNKTNKIMNLLLENGSWGLTVLTWMGWKDII